MEPERPIEKLLRETAKKRREEAGKPFELHPATRRLLHGEVARRTAKSTRLSAAADPPVSRSMFTRFAWGLAIAAGLVIAALLMVPPLGHEKGRFQLAERATENNRAYSAAPAPAPAAAPAPAKPQPEQPALAYAEKDKTKLPQPNADARLDLASRNAVAPAPVAAAGEPVPVAQPPAVASASVDSMETRKAVKEETVAPVLAGPAESAPDTLKKEPARELDQTLQRQLPGGVAQRFVELGTAADSLRDGAAASSRSQQAHVLASFDVQQQGNRLRLVDSDGSVYDGDLRAQVAGAPGTVTFGGLAGSEVLLAVTNAYGTSTPAAGTAYLPIVGYAFLVSGTNRSLNVPVTVSGTLYSDVVTNATPLSATQLARNRAASGQTKSAPASAAFQPAASPQPAPPAAAPPGQAEFPSLQLQSLRISGKAMVGRNTEIQINAVPDRSNTRPAPERQ